MRLDVLRSRLAPFGCDPGKPDGKPRAAVAAILRASTLPTEADLFFIRRAERASDPWSGHIAFPGGRFEETDATLLETAIRETREEVGLRLTEEDLVARLPDQPAFIRMKGKELVVTPFVFAVSEVPAVVTNHEVAETLWISFTKLVRGDGRGTYRFRYEEKDYDLPCIRLEPDQKVLWGLTHTMLQTMIEAAGKGA